MFGLTKREQRWKAERQMAELMVELAKVVVKAQAEVRVAEAQKVKVYIPAEPDTERRR